MMDARQEALSLRDEPLPPEPITRELGDELLPSRILALEKQIQDYESGLSLAREARDKLLKRAVALKIGKDTEGYIIIIESLSDRKIDVERFQKERPEEYKKAIAVEIAGAREKIQKEIDALGLTVKTIKIKTAEDILGQDDITLLSIPRKITTTYQVLSIRTPLPKGKGIKLLVEENP